MAMTLTEAAKLNQNELARGVVETITIASPVLDRLPFKDIQGNAFTYNEELTLSGVEFRAVNAAYAESTGTVNPRTESIVIMGGDADVDRFIVVTQGNLTDQRALQLDMKTKSAAFKFQDAFINGDTAVDANSFDGLKKRLTGSQVFAAGANGLAVLGASDAERHAFFDQLDALIDRVPGLNGNNGAIYMNNSILGKITSSMRRLTMYTVDLDAFGRRVPFYNGIPLLDIGTKADGTAILPQTEVQGTATTASSIYAVKFGNDYPDRAVTGLQNGGIAVFDKGLLETKNVYRHNIEWFPGLAVFGGKAAARMTGVLNA